MTSCHISLVKLKQYLSPFLCLISPCVPQKHATTFNRISFLHFLPPPFIFYNSIFSNTGILEFIDFLQCTEKPGMRGFYPLKTLFESEKNVIWLFCTPPPSPPQWITLSSWKSSQLGGWGRGVDGKRVNGEPGLGKSWQSPLSAEVTTLGAIVLAPTAGKPGFQFQLLPAGFVALSKWPSPFTHP